MKRQQSILPPAATIRDAMQMLDATALGIVMVADDSRRLLGTVTDGDIRREILRGGGLDEPVSAIMNTQPTTVRANADSQELRRLFSDTTLKQLPVVDESGRIVDVILLSDMLRVPLSSPDITSREVEAVLAVLQTKDLSLGPKVPEFESRIAAISGRRYAVAVNSGTSALHLVVRSAGLGEGDEVITTPFSFIASSNCILYERATPVFVDIEPDTYNIDPDAVEAAITPRTKAILAVDVFGQPARYDRLEAIAKRHGLTLILDSCESIGAHYRGRPAASFGDVAVFGFYPNKQVTTGEGGAVVTDDPEVAALCRSLRNQGRAEGGGWLSHVNLGYNYRLPDISCALGVVQLERLDEILDRRDAIARRYSELLAAVPGVVCPVINPDVTRMSWFVYVVRLDDTFNRAHRDAIVQRLTRDGIGVNTYFQPLHLQPLYRRLFGFEPGAYPVTEAVSDRTIALPFFNGLEESDIQRVVERVKEAVLAAACQQV